MPISLGIYDFFAFTIPGGITTTAIIYLLLRLGMKIDLSDVSIVEFILLVAVAYLMGYATDFLARKTLGLVLYKKSVFDSVVEEFNRRNPGYKVLSNKLDWYVSFAFIKKHDFAVAQEIDKLNVQNIMLKNASFGFLLFAVIFAFEFFVNRFNPIYGISSLICLILVFILARESKKYARWFFEAICQTLVALSVPPDELVEVMHPKEKPSRRSKK